MATEQADTELARALVELAGTPGYTQTVLAGWLGLKQSAVSNWKRALAEGKPIRFKSAAVREKAQRVLMVGRPGYRDGVRTAIGEARKALDVLEQRLVVIDEGGAPEDFPPGAFTSMDSDESSGSS